MRFSPEQVAGLPESSDRRARARRNPSALTSVEIGESNGGIILNVSETGIAISVAQSMGCGQVPSLSFRLPQLDRTFQTGGEIVWLSESKKTAGVRFVNLEERDRVQIRNWIRAEIVAAELQTPHKNGGPAAPKPVLIMPSPRKAVRLAESEAQSDEARAAEFDRMFPSEATLKAVEAQAEPEFNLLAATTEDEDIEVAAEAFLASREANEEVAEVIAVEPDAVVIAAPESQDIESAERESEAEAKWREEWAQQFQRERENLERSRLLETILELPAPFSAPLPDSPPATPIGALASAWSTVYGVLAANTASEPSEVSGAGKVLIPPAEAGLGGSGFAGGRYSIAGSAAKTGTAYPAVVARTKNENNPLSIAALCTVLVAMCFVLGYAIQPGAFRFPAGKSAETLEVTAAPNPTGQSDEEKAATSSLPASVVSPQAAPSVENSANSSAEEDKGSTVPAEKERSRVASAKNADDDPEAKLATAHSAASPAAVSSAPPAFKPSTTIAANSANSNSQLAPAAIQPPAPTSTSPSAGTPSTASAASSATPAAAATPPAAAIPVSFFPVTAPSAGSPAKLMQLPEETIAETSSIVIRSHQFLFVPAQAGLESEHPLERVHLGDRILKVTPAYPAQAWEKFQGGIVHLRSTIGPDGTVLDVQTISGPTSLIPAAANAVRQWRYKPTDIDGKPIPIEEDIWVEFRPSRETATK
jgi:TonB family protein